MAELIRWSDLPAELLISIAKLLGGYEEDVARIRAVCSSWRFSIPPPLKSLSFPILLSLPMCPSAIQSHLKLTSMPIYRLYSSNIQNRRNWCLVRVRETNRGEFQVLNPFEGRVELSYPQGHSKVINSFEFQISEMTKAYHLSFERSSIDNIPESTNKQAYEFRKVIVSSKPVSSANDYLVIALNSMGGLCHIKLGDDKWNIMKQIDLHGRPLYFAAFDILEHEGHFYVGCKRNSIFMILDYSLQVIKVTRPPKCHVSPCEIKLVESKGDLFWVHKHRYTNRNHRTDKPFEIRVYKWDTTLDKLREMKNLASDVVFVLCHDCCFSISTRDFPGLKGNCVYFMDDFCWEFANDAICKGTQDFPIYVYNLEDNSVGPLLSHPDNSSILWSIPSPDAN